MLTLSGGSPEAHEEREISDSPMVVEAKDN